MKLTYKKEFREDCTCGYDVDLDKEYTVAKLKEAMQEW